MSAYSTTGSRRSRSTIGTPSCQPRRSRPSSWWRSWPVGQRSPQTIEMSLPWWRSGARLIWRRLSAYTSRRGQSGLGWPAPESTCDKERKGRNDRLRLHPHVRQRAVDDAALQFERGEVEQEHHPREKRQDDLVPATHLPSVSIEALGHDLHCLRPRQSALWPFPLRDVALGLPPTMVGSITTTSLRASGPGPLVSAPDRRRSSGWPALGPPKLRRAHPTSRTRTPVIR